MKKIVALLGVLLCSQVKADDVPIVGADVPIPMYTYAELSVKTNKGDKVGWQIIPKPLKMTDNKDGKVYVSGKPGDVYIALVTIVNFGDDGGTKRFDQGSATITMDGTPVPSEGKELGLSGDLKAVFKFEAEDDKPLAVNLAQVYRKGALIVDTAKTWGELFTEMAKEAESQKVTGKLTITQRAIQRTLQSSLPSKGAGETLIDTEGRKKAKTAFLSVAVALEKLK